MFESAFDIAKTVLMVTVAIPMLMGLVLSLFGLAVLEWSRFNERRSGAVVPTSATKTEAAASSGPAKAAPAVLPAVATTQPVLVSADA